MARVAQHAFDLRAALELLGRIARLVPQWTFQTGTLGNFQTTSLLRDNILYVTGPQNVAWALDARTGRQIWRYRRELPSGLTACCGLVNRGFGVLGDKLFMTTLDAHLLALDMKTGNIVWDVVMEDFKKGYAATTTRELADALGVQKASIYYHIRSKEDLLHDICVESLNNILTAVSAAIAYEADPLARIKALIRAHVFAMLADRAKHATMLTELDALSPARRAEVVVLREEYESLVRGVLAHAQPLTGVMGEVREGDQAVVDALRQVQHACGLATRGAEHRRRRGGI